MLYDDSLTHELAKWEIFSEENFQEVLEAQRRSIRGSGTFSAFPRCA
jgi:hypothetical protein